ncbi:MULTISPECIES: TniQ family protein [unclassified Lysinibacillus]
MEIRRTFTIRPKLIEGESLSSYLIRTANLNAINSISEIWQLVKKHEVYKVDRNIFYKFDLFPCDIVHLNDLSILLNIKANELVLHSFEPIVSFFYPGAAGKMIFGKEIELKNRRFCKSCLNENKAYQLLWQVKEIHMCYKHFTRIESKCYRCGSEQPYLRSGHLEHLKCSSCDKLLFDGIEETIQDINIKNKQFRIYRDWKNLFKITSFISKNVLKESQPIHRKIAVLLLFLATPNNVRINSKKHPFYSPSQVKRLLEIVRNKSNGTLRLGFILNTLRELNIEISALMSLKVPNSFIRILLNRTQDKKVQVIECKSEWCEFYGTVHRMVDMKFSKGKYVPKEYLYSSMCVCTYCWVQVGYNKELSKWEETNISQSLLQKINSLFRKDYSEKQIIQQLNIYPNKVYFYLGYIYQYNPFCNTNSKLENRVVDLSKSKLTNNFSLLKSFWKKSELLTQQASNLFGWDVLSTFYYYWHPDVQQYIYLEENSRVTNKEKEEKLRNEVDRVIKHLDRSNIQISVKEVAAILDITESTLRYHNLNKKINEAKLSNKLNKEKEEIEYIYEVINGYIKNKKIHEEPILVHEVYKFLGISEKILKRNYPEIAKFISNSAKENIAEQKLIRRANLEKAIIHIYNQYGRVDYSLLSEYLGVTKKTLKSSRGVYKGIDVLIRHTLDDLEGD